MLLNAFSLNMVPVNSNISVRPATLQDARDALLSGGSAVGHADTARVFSGVLGVEVPCDRRTVTLERSEIAVIGQYKGPRLLEGATTLPEGARIEWILVYWETVKPHEA